MKMERFAFGKNWKRFLENGINQDLLQKSKESLKSFLNVDSLQGLTFVDIGCGSGIHSLAALELGAKVTSIDIDQDSVECARKLAQEFNLSSWTIKKGSILDNNFISNLGQFDIVYCWGVAHHTGNMEQALKNLSFLTKQGSYLYVAIYNEVEGRLGSSMWLRIKKFYNDSNIIVKKVMEWLYISAMFLKILIRFKNPVAEIRRYYNKRGMKWTIDLIDWLGGYPYEYAKAEKIFNFYKNEGMELINLKTTNHIGCNQFIFLKH